MSYFGRLGFPFARQRQSEKSLKRQIQSAHNHNIPQRPGGRAPLPSRHRSKPTMATILPYAASSGRVAHTDDILAGSHGGHLHTNTRSFVTTGFPLKLPKARPGAKNGPSICFSLIQISSTQLVARGLPCGCSGRSSASINQGRAINHEQCRCRTRTTLHVLCLN